MRVCPVIAAILLASGLSSACERGEPPPPDAPSGPARDPVKRALLVGIDEYMVMADLEGAENDVERVRHLLESRFEFRPENMIVLVNDEATREGILGAFERLIDQTRRGDIVVFHYSGHGSKMADTTGEETDGEDETIVPHDSRQGDVFDISDDELNRLARRLGERTDNVTFILDACHSGTGVRASGRVRAVEPDSRQPPPPPDDAEAEADDAGGIRGPAARFVLLAAARSDQFSFEYHDPDQGVTSGAFTYFLTDELDKAGAGATYQDVMTAVRGRMDAYYRQQSPQLEGAGASTLVFGDSTVLADPHLLVSPGPGGAVDFRAGAVHGLSEGSVYDIFPPGTRHFGADTDPIARARLTRVGSFIAEGELLDGGPIEANSRAVEREHAFHDQNVRVHFEGLGRSRTLQAVRAELASATNIREHPDPHGYTLLLRETGSSIVIEGPDAIPLSPPISLDAGNAVARVVRTVEEWSRWFNILGIRNPSARVEVGLTLSSGRSSGVSELRAGDPLTLEVTNRSSRDLFITILDLSTDGSITQLFPPEGGAELLAAGASETVVTGGVSVPDDRDEVRDHLMVFATSSEVDLSALVRGPVRGIRATGSDDPLAQLLEQAAAGRRNVTAPVALGDWAVVQRSIVVRR
jgi:hypothetical protein